MVLKQWDVFTQTPSSRRADAIRVSLSKRGIFALNHLAVEALKETEAVELLFDKINKLIGMRPCSPEQKNAFPLKRQGRSNSFYIRGRAFCHYYNIKVANTVVFDTPEVDEDGVLVLDLTKVSEIAKRKPRQSQEQKQSATEQTFVLGSNN